jgi:predicted Zn-dependent peptidase
MTTLPLPQESVLPNGVRVVTETMTGVASVSVGVFVGAGARAEAPHENGIAHLLEHMAFKGTRRRSAREIVEEIESVGGDINAATSMESTAYFARVLSADVPLALDILGDILTDSVLDPAELAREQSVIRQEIAAVQDTPDDLVFEHLQAAAFPGQPLGRSILGTEATVAGFTPADIRAFMDRHYLGPQIIVTAAGDVEHQAFLRRAGEHFGALGKGRPGGVEPGAYVGGEIREEQDLEQVNIAIALPGVGARDARLPAARLFSHAVGGGMASRLFQEVREKRGLCYTVSSYHWAYAETGLLGMHAATDPEDAAELVRVMLEEVARAARDLDETELARAKAQLRAGMLMSLESPSARTERLARQLLMLGRTRAIADVIAELERVTLDEVRAFGAAALAAAKPSLAVVGRAPGLASLDRLADIRA